MHLSTLIAAAGVLSCSLVQAHMQLSNPYPINSALNPATPENKKDYNYASPLNADGSNYPCKGYHTQTPVLYTASYTAGQSSSITLAGSASHGGGSCQIALSYDNGATFKVIKSIMGGCPLDATTYSFTVPSFAPAGNALLAWTWFNKIGNREFYMNCAWVHVAAGSSKKTRRTRRRDISNFNDLPNIFLANIPQAGGVGTIETKEVTFPYPGANVQYGGSITSSTPLGQGYTGTPPVQDVDSTPPSTSEDPSPSSTPTTDPSTDPPFPISNSTASDSVPTPTPPPTTTPPPTLSGPCSPSVLLCPSPNTFALCNADGTPTMPMPVAAGTQCSNGNIILADNSGPCNAPAGQWLCRDNGMSFSACSNGIWINMGSVAAGTACRDGIIVVL